VVPFSPITLLVWLPYYAIICAVLLRKQVNSTAAGQQPSVGPVAALIPNHSPATGPPSEPAFANPRSASACGIPASDEPLPSPASAHTACSGRGKRWIVALAGVHFVMAAIWASVGWPSLMRMPDSLGVSYIDRILLGPGSLFDAVLILLTCLLAAAFASVGVGFLRRRRWAWTSARRLAALGFLLSLAILYRSYIPLLVSICYCAIVYAVSLRKNLAAQFTA
jgi:hypothetical protein